MMATEVDQGKA